jgi:hypothetical protein
MVSGCLRSLSRSATAQSCRRVEARLVDGPAGGVTEADQLLRHVMSARAYPVSDFEQLAADISVDHPVVLEITDERALSRFVKLRDGRAQKTCARQ